MLEKDGVKCVVTMSRDVDAPAARLSAALARASAGDKSMTLLWSSWRRISKPMQRNEL
jgi:hypothetical protein